MWHNSFGESVDEAFVMEQIKKSNGEIHVGSDSQASGDFWIFATAICIYKPGKGGSFFYAREKFNRNEYLSLYDRLLKETTLSILAAEVIKENTGKNVVIHSDVSKEETESSKYLNQITGFIRGMGYNCLVKPNAWASSSVADRKTK